MYIISKFINNPSNSKFMLNENKYIYQLVHTIKFLLIHYLVYQNKR